MTGPSDVPWQQTLQLWLGAGVALLLVVGSLASPFLAYHAGAPIWMVVLLGMCVGAGAGVLGFIISFSRGMSR